MFCIILVGTEQDVDIYPVRGTTNRYFTITRCKADKLLIHHSQSIKSVLGSLWISSDSYKATRCMLILWHQKRRSF